MYQTRVTSKGQVTVPAEFRKKLGIESGDRVEFGLDENQQLVISKASTKAPADGFLRDKLNGQLTDEAIDQAIKQRWAQRGQQ